MHTKISPDNPYRYNRWCFACEHVPAGPGSHLDFGCNKGEFLNRLKGKKCGRSYWRYIGKKGWHEHFSRPKLQKLQEGADFGVIDFDGAGFFSRIIGNVGYFIKRLKPVQSALAIL